MLHRQFRFELDSRAIRLLMTAAGAGKAWDLQYILAAIEFRVGESNARYLTSPPSFLIVVLAFSFLGSNSSDFL